MALPPEREFYVGVDFDDTCVVAGKDYPEILEDMPGAVAALKTFVRAGCKILLITSRENEELKPAVEWFERHGIPLAGVNENPEKCWNGHRKPFCDVSVDDRNIGVPTRYHSQHNSIIDWETVVKKVLSRYSDHLHTFYKHTAET